MIINADASYEASELRASSMTVMIISMNMTASSYINAIEVNEHRFKIIVTRNLKDVLKSQFTHSDRNINRDRQF